MVLLLAGSTALARGVIVDTFLGDHADWRHLALEDVQEEEGAEDAAAAMQAMFGILVACECAKEVQADGYHIVITCPSRDIIGDVRDAFPDLVSVHLGKGAKKAAEFDHIVDTSGTPQQAAERLHALIAS